MLQLQNISLFQFKNYSLQQFHFDKKVIGICGLNGAGKTNLLDAIYYLSFTKSYLTSSDAMNVSFGKQGLRIEGNYLQHKTPHKLVSIVRENNKKEFLVDDIACKKFSEHIGNYPCVIIAPDDVELITGSSEIRRKLIDTILSQIDRDYLQHLINYNKILQQRNSLLKQFAENNNINEELLSILNHQLATPANYIFEARRKFVSEYLPSTIYFYKKIADKTDQIHLNYESQLNNASIDILLQNSFQKDLILQRTNVGIHKDDIAILMNENSFKNTASQGQRKSLLFAFKLAEWQIIKQHKGFAPILLLDDVFEKLDEQRMFNLLQWVCKEDDGQVFITDTHKERLEATLSKAEIEFQLIEL